MTSIGNLHKSQKPTPVSKPMNQNISLKLCDNDKYEMPNVGENNFYAPTSCRVCLNEGDIHIFHEENLGDISRAIFIITGIKVCPIDTFPKYLCHSCNETLQTALLFRQIAQESDTLLKKVPKNMSISNGNIKNQGLMSEQCKNNDNSIEYEKSKECKVANTLIKIKHTNKVIESKLHNNIKNKNMSEQCSNDVNSIELKKSEQCKVVIKQTTKIIESKKRKKVVKKIKCNKNKNIFRDTLEAGVIINCKKCSLEFTNTNDYGEHMLTEDHKNVTDICPFCHREYKCIVKHLLYHKKNTTALCSICGKSFLSIVYARHRESHFDNLPLKCPICPYKGRFSTDLKVHLRKHTGEKPYICKLCPQRFTSKSNLNRHTARHEEAYKFCCEICLKGFYTQREFDTHAISHSNMKIFSCDMCNKTFAYKKTLMRHTRNTHKREKLRSGRLPNYIRVQNEKN